MNAMEILLKQLGIEPEKIQEQVNGFQTLFESMQNSLVKLDERMARIEAHLNGQTLFLPHDETEQVNAD